MVKMHTSELADFVKLVDSYGGDLNNPTVAQLYPIELRYDTIVDQKLCPFSDAYFRQQIELYEEISGRSLDQASGELHAVEIETLLDAPNPLGILNTAHVSEHVRATSAMLSIVEIGTSARVIDLGAGHGLSSEVFAFSGCAVDAIDIDPTLGELAMRRANRLKLPITRYSVNFDDLGCLQDGYDAAFFFQSFHHCLRPWELIAQLKTKLKPNGVIAFTGEPIQNVWWKNWGLRLDHESLYVARALGWFESGWSREFIAECFAQNGMELTLFAGGHGGGQIGLATFGDPAHYVRRAASIGHSVDCEAPMPFATVVGEPCRLQGLEAFRSKVTGWLIFGPYIKLHPGTYEIFVLLRGTGEIRFDVTAHRGKVCLGEEVIASTTVPRALTIRVHLNEQMCDVEARIYANGEWECSKPQFTCVT
jgi:2-polyprenyl-3-methyl-5-hydroxy-6-metoxy-1,4-benzoquinol methylase